MTRTIYKARAKYGTNDDAPDRFLMSMMKNLGRKLRKLEMFKMMGAVGCFEDGVLEGSGVDKSIKKLKEEADFMERKDPYF